MNNRDYSNNTNDPWLGQLHVFPNVLHARALVLFDMNDVSFQKMLVTALTNLQGKVRPLKITISDNPGYVRSNMIIRVGIGNREGFDLLDHKEEDRLLARIEHVAPFKILDLFFRMQYVIDDDQKHKVHRDEYIVRLTFHTGRFDILLHHRRGVRRVDSDELIRLLVMETDQVLDQNRFSKLDVEEVIIS